MGKLHPLVSGLVFALLAGCSSTPENSLNGGTRSNVLAVDFVVTQPEPLANVIEVTGSLIPNESAELTTQVSGKVVSIQFEEGDRVGRGQTLLTLDAREWQAQLKRLSAERDMALKDLERKRELAKVKGISAAELEAAELRVQTLDANIDETEVRISYTTITAPFDGVIGLRNVSLGAFINAGTSVAKLVQDDPLKLEFNVPERYAGQIKTGQSLVFHTSDQTEVRVATIYASEPMIDPSARALKVRARAENADHAILPGAYVDLSVTLDSIPNAIMVPTEAIIPQLDNQLVYRFNNGKAEEVNVRTGVRESKLVQVTQGLNVGDTVVVTGLLQIRPGIPVRGDEQLNLKTLKRDQ